MLFGLWGYLKQPNLRFARVLYCSGFGSAPDRFAGLELAHFSLAIRKRQEKFTCREVVNHATLSRAACGDITGLKCHVYYVDTLIVD